MRCVGHAGDRCDQKEVWDPTIGTFSTGPAFPTTRLNSFLTTSTQSLEIEGLRARVEAEEERVRELEGALQREREVAEEEVGPLKATYGGVLET